MVEETPEQVTLDDLLPLDYVAVNSLGGCGEQIIQEHVAVCTRCGSVVGREPGQQYAHERWHAAIEDLTVTISAESTSNFFDNSPPPVTVKGSHALRTSVTPERVRELVMALGLDPNQAADCTWPAIMDRVRDQLTERRAEASASAPHEWSTQDMANTLASQGAALERLREVVRAAGCPLDTNVINWIEERLNDLVGSDHRETALVEVNRSLRGERDRLRAELDYVDKHVRPERDRLLDEVRKICEHLGAEHVWKHTYTCGDALRMVEELPERPTRDAYNIAMEQRALLERKWQECERLYTPATLPSTMPTVDAELAAKISQAVHDPGKFVDRDRTWDDPFDRWEYESVAAWGARAVMSILTPEAEAEVCPSLYLYRDGDIARLLPCSLDPYRHTDGNYHVNGDRFAAGAPPVTWSDAEAVPSPWPVDQEPPAGINLLADTGAGETLGYLCRVTKHWVWSDKPAIPHSPYQMVPWAKAVLDADGDLVVVRP
jgi:hypothetical protein